MKGVFFKNQLEFRLEVKGDEWHQGVTLACVLSIKNRGASSQELSDLYLHLACGKTKSIREKEADAFEIISSADISSRSVLEADQETGFSWSFALDKNCIISEKSQSLYLVCGKGALADYAGQLAVTVLPHPHIDAVTSLLENTFCFVLKGEKSKKGWVEAKLKPPSGKDFPTLEQLVLSMRFQGDAMRLDYCFHLKTIQADALALSVGKARKEVVQELALTSYLFPGGQVNHEPLEKALADALATVKSRI